MEVLRKYMTALLISKINKGISYCTFWMRYFLLQYLSSTTIPKKPTCPHFLSQTGLKSIKMNLISLQMHLDPNPSYSPHYLNFRFSEQRWLSIIIAKKFPPSSSSSCPPAFHFSFMHTGPLSSKCGWNAAWTRWLTYLSYSYGISHLSGLMTDAQMERAEAEITSLLSRCSGRTAGGYQSLWLSRCWLGCQCWGLVALLQPSCLGFNFSAKNGAFSQLEREIARCPLKQDFTR